MKTLKQKIRPFLNFYLIVGVLAFVWMAFFDLNSLVGRYERAQRIERLEADLAYYVDGKEELLESTTMLESDEEELERFARERFHMKKEGEDLFIIVDSKKE